MIWFYHGVARQSGLDATPTRARFARRKTCRALHEGTTLAMGKPMLPRWVWVLGCLVIAGCSSGEAPLDWRPATATVTWHEHVAPIVMGHCAGCHTEGAIGPMSLDSYAAAAPYATLMAHA